MATQDPQALTVQQCTRSQLGAAEAVLSSSSAAASGITASVLSVRRVLGTVPTVSPLPPLAAGVGGVRIMPAVPKPGTRTAGHLGEGAWQAIPHPAHHTPDSCSGLPILGTPEPHSRLPDYHSSLRSLLFLSLLGWSGPTYQARQMKRHQPPSGALCLSFSSVSCVSSSSFPSCFSCGSLSCKQEGQKEPHPNPRDGSQPDSSQGTAVCNMGAMAYVECLVT